MHIIIILIFGITLFGLFFYFMDRDCHILTFLCAVMSVISISIGVSLPTNATTATYYIGDEMINNENVALIENNCNEYTIQYIENNELKTIEAYKSNTRIYFDAEKPFFQIEKINTILFSTTSTSLHFETQKQMEKIIGNE